MTTASLKVNDALEDEEMRKRASREIEKMGLYQLTMYMIISVPLMLSATYSFGYAFTAGEVDYRCLVPECENSTSAEWQPSWINYAAPTKDDKIVSCARYEVSSYNNDTETCSASSFTDEEKSCEAWVYDPNETTIVNEWNITCGDRWKLFMVGTVNNIGQLVGLIFTGYLSDRFGRRAVLTIQTFGSGVIGVVQSFSVNYWMFVCLEFLQATASSGMFSSGFILGLEMVGEKRRVLGGTIISCWYAMGEILLVLGAMWLRSWRAVLRLFFIPGLFAIFLPVVVPESIRWLIANERTKDVEKIYKRMAKMNGFEMNEAKIDLYKELNSGGAPKQEEKEDNSKNRVLTRQALGSPKLVIRLLACFVCWFTNTFLYYGLSLNSGTISGDKYINYVLVFFIEIPANFLSCFLINTVGRKATVSGSFFLSGLFCLAILFLPKDVDSYLPLVMFVGGKGCITMAFSSTYVYTAEMFPTTARHSLLAMCSMTGRIGSILAPQTRLLASLMESLPAILFGCVAMLAGFVSLIFPETLGSKLPDTIAEAENIGREKPKMSVMEMTRC